MGGVFPPLPSSMLPTRPVSRKHSGHERVAHGPRESEGRAQNTEKQQRLGASRGSHEHVSTVSHGYEHAVAVIFWRSNGFTVETLPNTQYLLVIRSRTGICPSLLVAQTIPCNATRSASSFSWSWVWPPTPTTATSCCLPPQPWPPPPAWCRARALRPQRR